MTKLRKQRRRKVYRHNVNRKRLRNKIYNKGTIGCKEIKQAWEDAKSVKRNLLEMGLSYDPNKSIKSELKTKTTLNPRQVHNKGWTEENTDKEIPKITTADKKAKVVEELIKEARAPRAKMFRLPNSQVEWITYLLDKHGSNYKAMVRDEKNYNQETWKQLRAKIRRFKSIPEQYSVYLQKSGKTDVPSEGEYDSDD